ncbi:MULTISPECIES: T9SS type A sorting domain-containing protein [Bizionia]|uniref:T9SS type A sorting domain-containing protein n=1 Tax=Bizionia algoritergicola TaxID=291187 RepID=A0A5D0QX93_9FLAO|nr:MULTISPECIES: T9SS type A sorting domain-containing protein [Bizionia]OBX21499.1 hypothetical protein BAA08_12280 [Bizionia sp. APA-3]TYB72844.1 T9SS type A sorting domain-containing protein [Bizionia algoritergicola]
MIRKIPSNLVYCKYNLWFSILIFAVILSFSFKSYAQTTHINPTGDGGFETGATFAANGWLSNTPGQQNRNQWVINTGSTPGFSGTNSAYVTNARNTAPSPHTYNNGTTSVSHMYRDISIPAGEPYITLNFDWVCDGEGTFDRMRIWVVPTTFTPTYGNQIGNAGTAPTGRIQIGGDFSEQIAWSNSTESLPIAYAGTTFRIVFEWRNDGSLGGNPPIAVDNISLISDLPPPPPANDNPCSATPLTVNATCSFATYTNASATATTGVPAPVCASYSGNDVWFAAVVPANGTLIVDTDTGVMTDSGMAFYSGTCGALSLIECDDDDSANGLMSSITRSGLTPGQTIYIRVWEYANDNNGTFDICATTFQPCNTPTVTASTAVAITTATINWTAATPAPTGGYQYIVSPDNSPNTPGGDFTGNTGAGITNSNVTGLTPNTTYYVFVRSNCGSGNFSGWDGPITFTTLAATVPPNDNPCNAIPLTVNSSCSFATYTNEFATATSGVPAPGCGSYSGGDVWFTAVVPASGILIVDTDTGVITDSGIAFYSGTCAGLTLIECDDDGSNNGFMSSITRTGLTPGQTIFIRVWEYGNDNNGTFDICATTFTPCSIPTIDATPNTCEMVIDEAGTDPFAITPYNPNPSFTLDCNITSVDLATNAQMYETTTYDVIKIPYTYIGSLGATINNSTIANDDYWADDPTALGFPFCFYDNEYNYTLAGANSMITFDVNAPGAPYFMNGNNTPGTGCGYAFNNNLPSTAGGLFEQTIYGVYHDIDPTGLPANAITTRTQGVVGCRKFIAEWNDVPMFSDNSILYSGMIVLYETTNIIEVYIEEKRIDNNNVFPWNGGNAIVGLQGDVSSNEYIVAPCRNGLDANWEVTNEAWRFVPSGNSRLTGVEWYIGTDTSGVPDATTNTYTATAPGIYTAISTYSTCGGPPITLTDEVVITDGRKTWMGYIDNNWFIDGNWEPNGVPTSMDCVLIPDVGISNIEPPIADESYFTPPTPPVPAYALNLTVASTASLEVASNTKLVVTDWVHLDGSIDIRDSGSLIQINDGATNINNNTGGGAINMQRTATIASSYDYIYWSSPVEGFGVTNVSPGSSLIYQWIPTITGNGAGNYGNWQATTEAMLNGKGYIIRNVAGTPTPGTPEFVGRPNNGVITKAINRGIYNAGDYTGGGNIDATRLDDNWNLVGNPYPSAISANTFLNINTNIAGTVYLWRHLAVPSAINDPFYEDFVYNYNPNDYIAHNGTGSNPPGFGGDIAAGQAFFVLMEHATASTNENVIFNNTMRSASLVNSEFYRTNNASENPLEIEKHRIWLDLIAPNNTANSILVGYIENATNDVDRLFDGFELSETSNRFYSLINTEEMAIQGRTLPFDDADLVPLGVEIASSGNYSIALNTLDGLFMDTGQIIFIEDTYTNIIHNVRISPYSFNTEAGVFNDRFILRYTDNALSVEEFNANSGITITAPNSNYIKVSSKNNTIKSVYVYDMLGRELVKKLNINATEIILDNNSFSEGTYIVKATTTNNMTRIEKVILKR